MRRELIEDQNRYLVEHQRQFRLAADVMVEAIAVIGSVAKSLAL